MSRKNLRQTTLRPHPCNVRHSGSSSKPRRMRRRASVFSKIPSLVLSLLALACAFTVVAQTHPPAHSSPRSLKANAWTGRDVADPPGRNYQGVPAPTPQDEGAGGLRLE